MLKLLGAKPLSGKDTSNVLRVLDADPIASCMIAARVQENGLDPRSFHGEMWSRGGPDESLCFYGANLVPTERFGGRSAFVRRPGCRGPRMCPRSSDGLS